MATWRNKPVNQPPPKREGAVFHVPLFFFPRTVAGQRIPDSPWASYKPQHSHCHSRHNRQTIMGDNFLIADERMQQFSFTPCMTWPWHSITSSVSPAHDGPATRLPPSHMLLHKPHTQPPTSCFRCFGCTTSGPPLRSHSYSLKSAAVTCVLTQLNHRGRSWSWKCSFLQLPSNAWEPLLPATQMQLMHHQQYIHIIFWALK